MSMYHFILSLQHLMEAGVCDQVIRKYQPREECNGHETRDEQQAISFDVICGVFYILLVGLTTSAVCLFVEIIFGCENKRKTGKYTLNVKHE